MIHRSGVEKSGRIIDVGSGSTVLIDFLLSEGYQRITALDISEAALTATRQRLGAQTTTVEWLTADIRTVPLPAQFYDLWHDRAVFHFLTDPADRNAYLNTLRNALKPDGQLIMATFADDGPEQCSNLDVMRYSPEALTAVLGDGFKLIEIIRHTHTTPWESEQKFIHCRYQRL
ncbi:MAG: class I SAM-dependent methyltransferase [Chloroflexota bacterium]